MKSVVILAPSFTSLARFQQHTLEVKLQLMVAGNRQASLIDLDTLVNSPLDNPPLGRGLRRV